MNRREVVTALGCVVAMPLVAAAQQPERMRRIGIFIPSADNREGQARLQAFAGRLQQLGWTEGRNVLIDIRSVGGSAERSREVAAEFVALAPDVILSSGSVSTAALKRATTSMPVVFVMVNEPVAQGFVPSLSRPAGNITGFTFIDFSVLGKTVELLKTMAPGLRRIGLMFNPDTYPYYDDHLRTLQAEPGRPVEVVRAAIRSPAEIETVVAALAAQPGSGLAVLADGGFTVTHAATINAALLRHPMPSVFPWRQFVADGGLMSYGPDTIDIYRRSADYVDRIMRGAQPADLPVQQPIKFDLSINLKTATALGIVVPQTLLVTADEVIE